MEINKNDSYNSIGKNNQSNTITVRNHSIDTLRTVATLLVVLLHISSYYVNQAQARGVYDLNFIIGNVVDSFSRVSVPLFVMISGGFLLGRTESLKIFYAKRVSRILMPFVFWSLFYLLMRLSEGESLIRLIGAIILGYPYYHMWFLYMILGLYFITPFINEHILKVSQNTIWYAAVLCLFLGFSIEVFDIKRGNSSLFIFWFVNYLGYFILGFLMKDLKRVSPVFLICVYVVCSIIIALLTQSSLERNNNIYFYNYLSPFVIVGSISVYKYFSQIQIDKNFLSRIAPLTFGIYLIHPFVLHVLLKVNDSLSSKIIANGYLGIPVLFLFVFSLSLIGAHLLSKNRFLRKII